MKLMNTEEFVGSLKELMTELGKDEKDYSISFRSDLSKEEEKGSLTFVFVIKNKTNPKAKEYKLALYIFENKKTVTSFIINGRTLNLLFENSTIDSPKVALHYLKDILLSEVKWIRDIEDTIAKQKAEATKKKFDKRRQSTNRNDSYKNGGKSGYNKNSRPNNGSKPYNKNYSQGGRNNSVAKGLNIRTSKHPYEHSKTGGQK